MDSVIYAYKKGELPEAIVRKFPNLTLARVYGAIAFYLDNQAEIENYLKQNEIAFENKRKEQKQTNPEFYARLAKAKEENPAKLLVK